MPVHHFSIILAGVSDLTDEQVEALMGMERDVTIGVSCGVVSLDYDRGTQLGQAWAIYSALCEIAELGLKAKHIEIEERERE